MPGAAETNQRMSSLIPVVHRAESTSRNAPMAQKIVGRMAAPTGALTAAFGASQGAAHGLPGAVAGGVTGLMAPLVAGTPEGQMLAARAFNSPATGGAVWAVATPLSQRLVDYLRSQKTGTEEQGSYHWSFH